MAGSKNHRHVPPAAHPLNEERSGGQTQSYATHSTSDEISSSEDGASRPPPGRSLRSIYSLAPPAFSATSALAVAAARSCATVFAISKPSPPCLSWPSQSGGMPSSVARPRSAPRQAPSSALRDAFHPPIRIESRMASVNESPPESIGIAARATSNAGSWSACGMPHARPVLFFATCVAPPRQVNLGGGADCR